MDEPPGPGGSGVAVICWDRQGDQIIGHFTARQIRWLRDHVSTFRDAVCMHRDWCALERHLAGAIYIAEITGEYHQDAPAGISLSTDVPAWSVVGPRMSSAFAEHMLADADLVLGSLPATGGVVVLPDVRAVWAWIWSLYQCGMHLAFRLGLTWVPPHTETSTAAGRAERSFFNVRTWLMTVIDTLIDVADLPYPAPGHQCPINDSR